MLISSPTYIMRTSVKTIRQLVAEAVTKRSGLRNKQTGQYSFSTDFDRMCTCGHKLGVHTGEPPHSCMNDGSHVAFHGRP